MDRVALPVADAGLKKGGVVVEGDHQKEDGAGGVCPLAREARKLLKTLIRCAKMHEKITSFQLAEHAQYHDRVT